VESKEGKMEMTALRVMFAAYYALGEVLDEMMDEY